MTSKDHAGPEGGRRRGMDIGLMIALVLGAVGLVILALSPGSETTVFDDTPILDPLDDGTAIVTTLRAPGGLAPFGFQLIDPTHRVTVQFISGPDCVALVESGDPWPTPHPGCTGGDGVVGEVTGLGITADGASHIGVAVTVDRACYERVESGMPWPPDIAECVATG